MFGDLFNTRGDYAGGLFYSGARRYLTSDSNRMEPPNEFKTKKQLRNMMRGGQNSIELRSNIEGNTMNFLRQSDKAEKPKPLKISKKDTKSDGIIIIERDLNPSHWKESVQAGCRIWTNIDSGEVLDKCPWLLSDELAHSEHGNSRLKQILDSSAELGTGALVYDELEALHLFDLLDNRRS